MNRPCVGKKYIFKIEDITSSGEGVGRISGFTVFVDGAVPRDEVEVKVDKVKHNYAIGKAIKIISPSPLRQPPGCSYFGRCGGCQLQNVDYKYQLKLKEKIVRDSLERIGKLEDVKINPVIGMNDPYYYRNKAQYKLDERGIGFYQKRSHKVVNIDECKIQMGNSEEAISTLNEFLEKYNVSIYDEVEHKGVIRGVVERISSLSGESMLIIVLNSNDFKYTKELINYVKGKLPRVSSIYLNFNTSRGNVVLSQDFKLVYGKTKILDAVGEVKYAISPASFYQVNPVQTEVLYKKVKEYAGLSGKEVLFDLYCGIGTISLYLAGDVSRVVGIEVVEKAVEDGNENAKLNGIDNVQFIAGKAEKKCVELIEKGIKPDVVVMDPPRKGCDGSLLEAIISTKTKKIIYVSCNPATLARDLKILKEGGYEIKEVQPVDMFPHTGHVECIVLIKRAESRVK